MSTAITIENFARAETDVAIAKLHHLTGGFGHLFHLRQPTPLDQQDVIRMNRDTLYSGTVLDLSRPVVVHLPDTGGRYQSLQVIDQDHYTFAITTPGDHELTQENVGSRFAYATVRTFFDPDDVDGTHALQDAVTIEGGGDGPLDTPDWDLETLGVARDALNTLAKLGVSNEGAFGRRDEVDPIRHLLFSAAGWGGLPLKNTFAILDSVERNDGTPHVVTVRDVPVRAFWSIIVYDADGFIPENEYGVYSYNNVTARPNDDGSFTIHFGGDPDRINHIPIADGWNYAIRLYEPEPKILDGSWTFPAIEPVAN